MTDWKVVKYTDATGSVTRKYFGICCDGKCYDGLHVYRLPEERARHIVHCVNNHEKLVEALKDCIAEVWNLEKEASFEYGKESKLEDMPDCYHKASDILAELEAEKGGEL